MRRYAGIRTAATNTTSTTAPMWAVYGAATFRLALYDLLHGADATPADNYGEFNLVRATTLGTTSATFTPQALDPGDPAALGSFVTTWSLQPTVGAATTGVLQWTQNSRAAFRWVAVPDGEIIIAATAAAGLACMPVGSNTATTYQTTIHWRE